MPIFGIDLGVFVILIIGWLSLVSLFLFRMIYHYNNLTKGTKGEDLKSILEEILQSQKNEEKEINQISRRLKDVEGDIAFHLQRVGVVRFNPFQDQGGDQSFAVAFLDKNGDGLVLSSLHSRTSTRIYAKPILKGEESKEYPLSKEEEEAVKKALKKS